MFHICLEVEAMEEALAELKGKGVKLIDERPRIGHANSRIAFIDPESTGNVLIELVELPNPTLAVNRLLRLLVRLKSILNSRIVLR